MDQLYTKRLKIEILIGIDCYFISQAIVNKHLPSVPVNSIIKKFFFTYNQFIKTRLN